MDAELVKNAPDDRVGQFIEILGMAVEGRGGREDDRTCLGEGDDIARMDQIPRGLPGDDDQLAALLQEDIGGTQDQVLACSGGDPADCPHRTGHDNHAIEKGAAAGKGGIHRLLAVLDDAVGQFQFPDLFPDHLLRVWREDEVNLVISQREMMEESLEIDRPTGSGGGKDESHDFWEMGDGRRWKE